MLTQQPPSPARPPPPGRRVGRDRHCGPTNLLGAPLALLAIARCDQQSSDSPYSASGDARRLTSAVGASTRRTFAHPRSARGHIRQRATCRASNHLPTHDACSPQGGLHPLSLPAPITAITCLCNAHTTPVHLSRLPHVAHFPALLYIASPIRLDISGRSRPNRLCEPNHRTVRPGASCSISRQ
ncbi:hypothetical protein DAEQUDRAFT_595222 [Daedalea quercina L-15889]|uniref:Uncharacterized protein n=1 Tax=Daedalea quercina L-15889 TaxID=1314783 RepID=A0A165SYH3_9APHY|nr:hypothetical protein DAEQUDRAFT_595222 [Daedalea quercina L-15889]